MGLFGTKKETLKTSKVFKNSGVPEYTFVERNFIKDNLSETVDLRNKAVFFLGYSKSGKTVYRKKFFVDGQTQYIVYRCSKDSTVTDLYVAIAREAEIGIKTVESTTSQDKSTETVGAKLENNLIGGVSGTDSQESSNQSTITKNYGASEIDINVLCNGLSKKNVIIFLEDYHLVKNDFNQKFSEDLKHFLDEEILFVVVGIPGSPGRAFQHNPDLTGRSISLNFDFLSEDEATEIIKKGEACLNVKFADLLKSKILKESYCNAFLIQSICYESMILSGVSETCGSLLEISDIDVVNKACRKVAEKLEDDYKSLLEVIVKGARTQKEGKAFNQYEEVVRAIKETDVKDIESGLSHTYIAKKTFDRFSPEDIDTIVRTHNYKSEKSFKSSIQSQVTQALGSIEENFEKSKTRKILIVHDQTIFLMDIIFKFYLDWENKYFPNI